MMSSSSDELQIAEESIDFRVGTITNKKHKIARDTGE